MHTHAHGHAPHIHAHAHTCTYTHMYTPTHTHAPHRYTPTHLHTHAHTQPAASTENHLHPLSVECGAQACYAMIRDGTCAVSMPHMLAGVNLFQAAKWPLLTLNYVWLPW